MPIAQLDHSRRALLIVALTSALPDLSSDALEAGFDWTDVADWISSATAISSPSIRRVALRVINGDDLTQLYRAAFEPSHSYQWRFRGATLSFDQFAATFHDAVLTQFAVVDQIHKHRLQGLVTAYNYDATSGHAYFAYLRALDASIPGALTEGLAVFLMHLFSHFPLRLLYCELPAFNQYLIEGLADTGLFELVARYPDHLFSQGRFQDLFVYRITRQAWYDRFGSWDFRDAPN